MILLYLGAVLISSFGETKICDVGYYNRANAVTGFKNEFEYYPWHNFENLQTKVKFLHIRRSNVKHICKASLPVGLDEVVLVDIKLEYIEPRVFEKNPVQQVIVEGNNLSTINHGIFNGTRIKSLVLNDNKIEKIEPYSFEAMPFLEAVALERNRIKIWDSSWFKGAEVLHEVSLANNALKELPEHTTKYIVSDYEEYTTYVLSGNINFDNNNIEYIHPQAFENLDHFGTISLSNNKLLILNDSVFKGFKFLFSLHLNTNNFICFSDKVMEGFRGVKKLFLGRNKMNKICSDKLRDYFLAKNDLLFL